MRVPSLRGSPSAGGGGREAAGGAHWASCAATRRLLPLARARGAHKNAADSFLRLLALAVRASGRRRLSPTQAPGPLLRAIVQHAHTCAPPARPTASADCGAPHARAAQRAAARARRRNWHRVRAGSSCHSATATGGARKIIARARANSRSAGRRRRSGDGGGGRSSSTRSPFCLRGVCVCVCVVCACVCARARARGAIHSRVRASSARADACARAKRHSIGKCARGATHCLPFAPATQLWHRAPAVRARATPTTTARARSTFPPARPLLALVAWW